MTPLTERDPRRLIARLAVAVIAADGRVTSDEIDALGRLDELGLGTLSDVAAEEIQRAVKVPIDVHDTCAGLAFVSPAAAAVILSTLAELAGSDRAVSTREAQALNTVGRLLGVSAEDITLLLDPMVAAESPGAAADAEVALASIELLPAPAPAGAPAGSRSTLDDAFRSLGLAATADRARVDEAYLRLVHRYNPVTVAELGVEFAALAARKLGRLTAAYDNIVGALGADPR